jgi:formate dehydrogenase subunit gamma
MTSPRAFDAVSLCALLETYRDEKGAMLPVLHAVQHTYGYVPAEAVPAIAKALNVSRAEVHGVITYYHHFREHPAGRTVIQICRAEACQALGCEALSEHAQRTLKCGFRETRADRAVTLEPVYCLGHCSVGPNILVGEKLYARMTPERFDAIAALALGGAQ